MKKNGFLGLLVILLVLGFIGCGENTTDDTEFIVTFDLDGGNINGNTESVQIKIKSGGTISNLPNPQRTENSTGFGGWFTQKNGFGNEFNTTTKVSSNLTVYAKWKNPFLGKWGVEEEEEYAIEFFADLTFFIGIITDGNYPFKGIYSFNETTIQTHTNQKWNGSSWDDFVSGGTEPPSEYVINDKKMTVFGMPWIKQD